MTQPIHFIGTPSSAQRFRLPNGDPRAILAALAATYRQPLLPMPPDWPTPLEGDDNPQIPAGFTYLLQLIGHDLVDSTPSLAVTGGGSADIVNLQRSPLKLRTLYGDGPASCPFAYVDAAGGGRYGELGLMPRRNARAQFAADILRVSSIGRSGLTARKGGVPRLCDMRNDVSPMLAQTTLLFHLLHNRIMCTLTPDPAAPDLLPEVAMRARFGCARDVMILIYRAIIREDVLPRLLHPAILKRYKAGEVGPLHDPARGIPLEFSHAAFRIGHVMARESYEFSDAAQPLQNALSLTSRRNEIWPLSADWMIDWAAFYDLDPDREPQRSRRLAPRAAPPLVENNIFFPFVDSTGVGGLIYRDLTSSALAGLWSVGALLTLIGGKFAKEIASSWILANPGLRGTMIETFLEHREDPKQRFPANTLAALAQDPPLAFFVMFEAMVDPCSGGTRLGVLGSILVADVLFGALRHSRPQDEEAGGLRQAIGRCTERWGFKGTPGPISEIVTMEKAIAFARSGG